MASSGFCDSEHHGATCPDVFGPYTTCYNRFVRWRRAGVWGRIMDALAIAHDASVQMIDTSIVRAHQHGACAASTNLPAVRQAIIELIARPPPQRCPHCQKWICKQQQRK